MSDLQLLSTIIACMMAGVIGFLIRLALESWRDWHVAKALHEAQLERKTEADHVHRYRRMDRRKRQSANKFQIPKEILADIKESLRNNGKAKAKYDHGRWIKAA